MERSIITNETFMTNLVDNVHITCNRSSAEFNKHVNELNDVAFNNVVEILSAMNVNIDDNKNKMIMGLYARSVLFKIDNMVDAVERLRLSYDESLKNVFHNYLRESQSSREIISARDATIEKLEQKVATLETKIEELNKELITAYQYSNRQRPILQQQRPHKIKKAKTPNEMSMLNTVSIEHRKYNIGNSGAGEVAVRMNYQHFSFDLFTIPTNAVRGGLINVPVWALKKSRDGKKTFFTRANTVEVNLYHAYKPTLNSLLIAQLLLEKFHGKPAIKFTTLLNMASQANLNGGGSIENLFAHVFCSVASMSEIDLKATITQNKNRTQNNDAPSGIPQA